MSRTEKLLNSLTRFAFEPDELGLVFASEQIFRDYKEFIKTSVMPEMQQHCDLRLREVLTLICIDSAVQPVSAKEVATIIRQDPATMSRSTLILIGKKYIVTLRNVNDHRAKILQVTPEGKKITSIFREVLSERFGKLQNFIIPQAGASNMTDVRFNMIVPFQERARHLSHASSIPAFSHSVK